ncbi:MAG TPA: pilus assembly protein PilY, partial [Halothiobacillaceae bacterium]|nr:pilus assembly protein PilY [Halothiobacillaceae bacterium]
GDLTVSEAGTDTDNGLAAPATFDTDEDGVQEWAYAGDLLGNVWEFDLDKGSQQVIFQTEGPASQEQPITAGLLLGKESSTGDLWAFFGTGKYLGESYRDDLSSIQSWYGIVVQSSNNKRVISTSDTPDRSPTADSALVERFVEGETAATNDRLATRVFTKGPDLITDGNSPDKGWFIDLLPSTGDPQGERMVVPNQFQGSVLLGTSLIPEAVDVCNPSGRGYIMGLNPFQGTNVAEAFVDANGDGQVNAADKVTIGDETYAVGAIGFSRIPNAPIFVGSTMLISFDDGSTASVQTSGGGTTPGRMSWREIVGD